jgi:allophanate hydrolase
VAFGVSERWQLYAEHRVRPLEAAEASIAADHRHDDPAIWIARLPDDTVLARARDLQDEGPRDRPLWGVPFAVKDNIDIAGMPTTAACPGFSYVAPATARAVQCLLDAGALLLGKTNLDQFATGLVGTRSPYGVPRNLFDATRVPGGSSSGSGCAVAAGIVPFALGTDTAGSGRVPAAFGNIVGLKPTRGSVSTCGVVPACRSLDTVSVLARTVDETLRVQRVIAGYDVDDPYSRRAPFAHLRRCPAPPYARIAMGDVAGLCDPETAAVCRQIGPALGAAIVDVAPFLQIARLLYEGPWVAERTAELSTVLEKQPDILLPVTRTILESGLSRLATDAFATFHRLAEVRRLAERMFCEFDALLLPTAPFCPTLAAVADDPFGPNRRLGTLTNFVNLCDLAGYAVPVGFGIDGLPVGAMLLGPAWSEGRLAGLADALHRRFVRTVGATRVALPPADPDDGLAAEETALFCIGPHMSGLPLNHQLRALGGRFLRAAFTEPAYRLYALGDRPGMLSAADGAALAGEVWALPTTSIGSLLSSLPPPLGVGTIELQDGPCRGFLAESAGIAGAPDITRFGGWRAWLEANR